MRLQVMVIAAALHVSAAAVAGQQARGGLPQSPAPSPYVDASGGLSLDAAIARALAEEPGLRAARTSIDAAAGRTQQAALRANPTGMFERRTEAGGTDRQTMAGVQLPLELFRRDSRIAVAERELDVTRLDVAERERQVAAEVRARYGEVLVAIRELSVLDELLSAVRQQLDIVAARAKEGAAPPLERDLLDVELRRLSADRRLQAGRVESALVQLRRVVGQPPTMPLTVSETLEVLVARESPPLAAASQNPVERRPDVQAARARLATTEARIGQAQSEGRADVTLYGSYMRMDAGFPQQAFGSDGRLERVRGAFNYFTAGAMVMVPLFNRNQGAVAVARADRAGAEAAHDAAVLQAESEIAAARAEDAAAQDAVAQYREGAQRLARQNVGVVAETFQLGGATIFDVLSEQRRYLEIERAYTDALRSAFEARTRLQLALGDIR